MSDAVALAPRAAKLDLVGWWIAPPLIVLAVLFLYPLALIAHAALVDEFGAPESRRGVRGPELQGVPQRLAQHRRDRRSPRRSDAWSSV